MRLPVVVFQCEEDVARVDGVLHCERCGHDLVEWLRLSPAEQAALMQRVRSGSRICIDVPARDEAALELDFSDLQAEIDAVSPWT